MASSGTSARGRQCTYDQDTEPLHARASLRHRFAEHRDGLQGLHASRYQVVEVNARDHMSLPTEFAVCDALIAQAVTGNERQSEAAIVALHELGYGEAAMHIDEAVSLRRQLSTDVGDHSVKASPIVGDIIAYVGVRENGRNPRS